MNTTEQKEIEAKQSQDKSYRAWLAKPETKMMISFLPSLDTDVQRDCFHTLLRGAYDAGHTHGGGEVLVGLIKGIMASEAGDKRR